MGQTSSSPFPEEQPEIKYFELKVPDGFARVLRNVAAHDADLFNQVMKPLSYENYLLKTLDYTSFKVPDSLINMSATFNKNYELILPPALKQYISHENAFVAQIKKFSANYPKPNESLMRVIEQHCRLIESATKASKMWQDLQLPTVIDGMLTVPKVFVPHLNMPSDIAKWAREYTSMYLRIAEELRRERETLEAMLNAVKASPVYTELELLMRELGSVCELSEGVHQRLCIIEKLTIRKEQVTYSVVDDLVAGLRLDHGRLDDALVMIGEITVGELVGENPIVSRTWYRLKLVTKRLLQIDSDLERLFQCMLD
ncbi:MAG: hypothetical protein IPK73_30115 [Candidatus Obscuribacter sp.]|nr:hypothetical protein [Candidatus Obscuribacter sp.]